ncbi:BON domain-containing protein [Mucilaginibacter antarcticus]|uniref:BON domain-containing protein n=1 Tax=Mucilaginibacter antarcticus TaxID=1855725 RepID=A0ABW5XQU9_9SPHI
MKNDRELQKDIQDALKWDPLLKNAQVDVIAQDGLVTLSGVMHSFLDKLRVETVTKSIAGVKAIAEHMTVNLGTHDEVSDEAIAKSVLDSLQLNLFQLTG